MSGFSGKKVMVLGGSRGIGAAIVRRFAADGAEVVFTFAISKDEAKALSEETGSAARQVDSGDILSLIKAIEEESPIDILTVNAGVGIMGDPLQLEADAVDRLIDINIRAPYFASVEAARQMRDGSRIIIIGSCSGSFIGLAGLSAYVMSKAAMTGMVRGLARDFGAKGITVNVVQPGTTATDLVPSEGPMRDVLLGFPAIKRYASGSEIAGMVAYLASEEAAYVTGATHTIDGGYSA